MELPYATEYDELIQLLNQGEWVQLKEKLRGPDVDSLGHCLQGYIAAIKHHNQTESDYEKLQEDWGQAGVPNTDTERTYVYWREYGRLKEECRRSELLERIAHEELWFLVNA